MGCRKVDWPKLIGALLEQYGSQTKLSIALTLDGIYTNESSFRETRRGNGNGSIRDRAVWLVMDAQKRGISIPYRDDSGPHEERV